MRDSQWIIPASILLLVQHVTAWALSLAIGFRERPPTMSYMVIAFILSLTGGLAYLLWKLWSMWTQDEPRPVRRLLIETDYSATATYLLGFQLVALQIAALTWLKEMLPLIAPFWADPALASLDRTILGIDAWRAVPATIVPALDAIYPFWAPVKFFGLLLMLFLPASPLKSRALLAYFLTVGLLGVSGQYLLSSGGPLFYDRLVGGNEFASLNSRIDADAPIVSLASAYLWNAFLARDTAIGGGISAMPSMHVATTAWMALALSAVWPRVSLIVWAFWLAIFIASFGLGWHYFTDGLFATVGAILCWKLADYYCQQRPVWLASGKASPDRPVEPAATSSH